MSKPLPQRKRSQLRDTLLDLTASQRVAVLGIFVCLGLKAALGLNLAEYLTAFGAIYAWEGVRKAQKDAE
jgi:hypothetical protein